VASAIAVEKVRDTYLGDPSDHPREGLVAAFGEAHRAIQAYAQEHPEFHGMGTTCTCAVLKDHLLYYGHVGDSRLYLIRDAMPSLITEDHTYVRRLVREGAISAEEAAVHPERNVLTAALGMQGDVPADFSEAPISLQAGDVLVLCSDGLHGLVGDPELAQVATSFPAGDACQELVRLAKARGGFDNITVQILRIF
jgi:protein phosphatase